MENIGTPINDRHLSTLGVNGMIEPFVKDLIEQDKKTKRKVISYGLSSVGYDVRLGDGAMSPSSNANFVPPLDAKVARKDFWGKLEPQNDEGGLYYLLVPKQMVLATTVEYFRIPKNIVGYVYNKSTYARNGIWMPTTILEPGWEGNLTLEIYNQSGLKNKLYVGEGIAQVIFTMIEPPMTTYADRNGKYMNQHGVTLAK